MHNLEIFKFSNYELDSHYALEISNTCSELDSRRILWISKHIEWIEYAFRMETKWWTQV